MDEGKEQDSSVAEIAASVASQPDWSAAQHPAGQEEALRWFIKMLVACGGQANADDTNWNPINVFCDDFEPLDTFNRAHQCGFTRVSHDTSFDTSNVYLTDAGRAWLSAQSSEEQPLGSERSDETIAPRDEQNPLHPTNKQRSA